MIFVKGHVHFANIPSWNLTLLSQVDQISLFDLIAAFQRDSVIYVIAYTPLQLTDIAFPFVNQELVDDLEFERQELGVALFVTDTITEM